MVAIAGALGFGATQAFVADARTNPSGTCYGLECYVSCTQVSGYDDGYCARDESGFLRCYCVNY